jgi:flagellar basal body-associated protein FliL
MMTDKVKGFFIASLVGILIAAMALIYQQRDRLDLPDFSPQAAPKRSKMIGQIRCTVVSSTSGRNHLRLKVAIPCQNTAQRLELKKKLPRLQHELIMSMGQPEMEEFVRQRNFEAMRRELLQVVNRVSKKPVNTLYFEGFVHN